MSDRRFSVEVVMAAYNRANYTRLALEGYTQQNDPDFSLVIADDGSGPEIAALVEEFRGRGLNIRHVWHEDKGFRRAEILNKAVASSTADYLIFTDNDCMPQREFIADHKRMARPGLFVVGRRVLLNEMLSQRFVAGDEPAATVNDRLWLLRQGLKGNLRYVEMGMRIPWFLCRLFSRKHVHLLGANAAVWRRDVLAVNGYDNEFVGYGMEDTDFERRLVATGLQSQSIKGRGCVVHLYHEERQRNERNADIVRQREVEGIVRVRNGVVRDE